MAKVTIKDAGGSDNPESSVIVEDTGRLDSDEIAGYTAQIEKLEAKITSLATERDKLSARCDALEATAKQTQRNDEAADFNRKVKEAVKERFSLEKTARELRIDQADMDKVDALGLKRLIAGSYHISKERVDSYSEEQLNAVLEVVKGQFEQRADSYEQQKAIFSDGLGWETGTQDECSDNYAYKKDAIEDAWRKDLDPTYSQSMQGGRV